MSTSHFNLDRMFNPKVVAVIGDKKANGYMFLRALKSFPGPVYSVQIDPNEIPNIEALGFKNYHSLMDIAEPVDFAIIAVPRNVAPRVVADCIKKQVGGVTLFTSGFAETNTEEGRKLQDTLQSMAREGSLCLNGPNCMGIYHPKAGLRFQPDQWTGQGGSVAFIAQSGTHLSYFASMGPLHGLKVSKSISYGNAIIMDSPDYLDYFVKDPDTKAIGMYIEGVKNGRRFVESLKAAAEKKPVVIWKGGLTEEGTRATSAHTAALAESPTLWRALIRQYGAIQAANLDDIIDILKGVLYMKPVAGNRVGLVSLSGGQSVAITDAFATEGLKVPQLSQSSIDVLGQYFTLIGGSYRNPFDISAATLSIENLDRLLNVLDKDNNIDVIAMEISTMFLSRRWEKEPKFMDDLVGALKDFKARSSKGMITIVVAGAKESLALDMREKLVAQDIPTYSSFARGAQALRKVIDYHRRKSQILIPKP
ncbi:MAG: CoA-binding protein [Chloroflexi bacterium]|nr:CoA-binding protein [Chloroflexota bacterium]